MWNQEETGIETKVKGNEDLMTINDVSVRTFAIPTDFPESDGTYKWNQTILVLVEIKAGNKTGIGYTYADLSTAKFINEHLKHLIVGQNVFNNTLLWNKMILEVRNFGRLGISSMAISAIDIGLWDLKAKILNLPLVTLLGQVQIKVAAYGSGGFTSYSDEQLADQYEKWISKGAFLFKMKVGRHKNHDERRIKIVKRIIGWGNQLFIDGNGSYFPKEALIFAEKIKDYDIKWFEEPVSSDNLNGLRFVREHAPANMEIAAGEYGFSLSYFHHMLEKGAVDVLQADATRCTGITGFLKTGMLCEAYNVPLSAHAAPSVHLHPGCAMKQVVHVEYFHDHTRIEKLFFDGYAKMESGYLQPDLSRPGLGIILKEEDVLKYEV